MGVLQGVLASLQVLPSVPPASSSHFIILVGFHIVGRTRTTRFCWESGEVLEADWQHTVWSISVTRLDSNQRKSANQNTAAGSGKVLWSGSVGLFTLRVSRRTGW